MEKGVGAAARVFTRARFFTTATFCDSCPTLFVQQAVSCVSCSFVLFQAGNINIAKGTTDPRVEFCLPK